MNGWQGARVREARLAAGRGPSGLAHFGIHFESDEVRRRGGVYVDY